MKTNPDAAAAILAGLRPVRPLPRPWQRGFAVCAVGVAIAAVVSLVFGVRHDASRLGPLLLWGGSVLQGAYGALLVAAALRESVPGRDLARGTAPLLMVGGAALAIAITLLTWSAHPSHVPAGHEVLYARVCFRTPIVLGFPALVVALFLAFRAYPTRPALVGTLAGLGAGLLTDGSWRTFCEVSAPTHVVSTHLLAVAALTLTGALLAPLVARLRWGRGR